MNDCVLGIGSISLPYAIYGDRDEMVFPFSPSRNGDLVTEVLADYRGVLLSDGYKVYDRYAERVNRIVHAQSWSHTRRNFIEAEAAEPELSGYILNRIALRVRGGNPCAQAEG